MPEFDSNSESHRGGLQRSSALAPLSREHHHALVHARWLRRAAANPDTVARARAAVEFLEFFATRMEPHFRAEEEILVPALVDSQFNVVPFLEHHTEIRRLASELRTAGPPSPSVLGSLGSLVEAHVRYEERVVFEHLQAILPIEQLTAIGEALERHDDACRLEDRK